MDTDAKRCWNWMLWVGFALSLLAFVSYFSFFVQFPWTRNFPWANLLLFALAAGLLAMGMRRAFRLPEQYRGKFVGSILAGLSVLILGLFVFSIFIGGRRMPADLAPPDTRRDRPHDI